MVEIKMFDSSHTDGILRIENECFEEPWSRESIEEQLDNPNARYFVLIENGEVAGYGGMWCIAGEGDIMNIGVLPEKRRKGYGEKILLSLTECMKKENLSCLNLEVRASNSAAISLYEKHGFYRVGLRKKYYHGREDALLLRRDNLEYTGN